VLLSLLLAGAGVLALPGVASAHAQLESTNPANGAVLGRSPAVVDLHFGEAVEVALGGVRVFDAAQQRVDNGDTRHPGGRASHVEVSLRPGLPTGTYLVAWRVVSADSHPVAGAFTFSVGAPGAVPKNQAEDAGPAVGAGLGVTRFLEFAGLALLLGGSLFVTWCWSAGAVDGRARRLLAVGWWVSVLSTLAGLLLQGPYGAGLGLSSVFDAATLHATVDTRFGHAQLARLALLLLYAGTLVAADQGLRAKQSLRGPLVAIAGALGICLLITVAFAGHAADGSDLWLAVPVDVAHLAAMAAWLGGLATLSVCVLSGGSAAARDLRVALPRFSRLAAGCVAILVMTGTYAAWRDLGAWGALIGTEQGVILLVKLAVLAVLLLAAAFSRHWVRSRKGARTTAPWSDMRQVRRSIVAETGLAVGVLGVTAALVAAPPGKNDWRPASSFDLAAGPVRLQLSVVPLGRNRLDLHAYTFTAAGMPQAVPELTATADESAQNISGLPVPFTPAGPGHFLADGVTLPASGQWTLDVHVRTSNIDEYTATAQLTVR
jgi:copper transport protein